MKNFTYTLGGGIHRSPEFEKKGLAEYAVNVGLRCGHDCTYCSSRAMLRCHTAFQELGRKAFDTGYSIVDPSIPERVAEDAKRLRRKGLVQICTTVDAWAPEAQELHLGRRCLEAILAEPGWTVRVLTKNAAVADDFDLIRKHRERVIVGLSLTGTPDKDHVLAVVEPHASPVSERMAALRKAHKLGLRTYGMLCPLLPGIADAPAQIDELVQFVKDCGAEEVFSEAINARGNSLTLTEQVLRDAGFLAEADSISAIRKRTVWSQYVVALFQSIQQSMRTHMTTEKLRFLLYPSGLADKDRRAIKKDDAGVVWL
ncbi:MAG: radical SAM protein [Planctomycetaceae bacterium]|nr:radical SAM protein [Planctomycetaceae bacterium]